MQHNSDQWSVISDQWSVGAAGLGANVMGGKTELESWCEKVAELGVDALVDCGLIRTEDFAKATGIVAEEILVRLSMQDYPPTSAQSDR